MPRAVYFAEMAEMRLCANGPFSSVVVAIESELRAFPAGDLLRQKYGVASR